MLLSSIVSQFVLQVLILRNTLLTTLSVDNVPFFIILLHFLLCWLHCASIWKNHILSILRWNFLIFSLKILSSSCVYPLPFQNVITSISSHCTFLDCRIISFLFNFGINLLKSYRFFQRIISSWKLLRLVDFVNILHRILVQTLINLLLLNYILLLRRWMRKASSIGFSGHLSTSNLHLLPFSSNWTIVLIIGFFICFHNDWINILTIIVHWWLTIITGINISWCSRFICGWITSLIDSFIHTFIDSR